MGGEAGDLAGGAGPGEMRFWLPAAPSAAAMATALGACREADHAGERCAVLCCARGVVMVHPVASCAAGSVRGSTVVGVGRRWWQGLWVWDAVRVSVSSGSPRRLPCLAALSSTCHPRPSTTTTPPPTHPPPPSLSLTASTSAHHLLRVHRARLRFAAPHTHRITNPKQLNPNTTQTLFPCHRRPPHRR